MTTPLDGRAFPDDDTVAFTVEVDGPVTTLLTAVPPPFLALDDEHSPPKL